MMISKNSNLKKLETTLQVPILIGAFKEVKIDCGEGWFHIIQDLANKINALSLAEGLKAGDAAWPLITTVKEKFGELRVYFQTTSPALLHSINEAVNQATIRSKVTCDCCGKPGQLIKIKSIMATRCAEHA